MSEESENLLEAEVPADYAGKRLDWVLAQLFSDFSRSRLQRWLAAGEVAINGVVETLQRRKLLGGEWIELHAQLEPEGIWEAEPMELNLLYEDEAILVLNKPVGLVVHPAPGHFSGTLLNGLLAYHPPLAQIPRAGIVHRLDRDTSGLMVVAKTLPAQTALVAQLQQRSVSRRYEAVVEGVMTGGGRIEAPIGRHPRDRKKMAVVMGGRDSITHYRLLHRFTAHSHLSLQLETGRTHQIRVHLSHIHYPLVGDPLYGGRLRIPAGCSEQLRQLLQRFGRQALHAVELSLDHPIKGERIRWSSPLPPDMVQLLTLLQQESSSG